MEEKTTKLFEDEENTIWSVGVEGNWNETHTEKKTKNIGAKVGNANIHA